MINIKNIIKILLMTMFICVCSFDVCYATGASANASNTNIPQDATFCGANKGVFSELVMTGQKIFNRLRDLIYVVAGFGIIGIAVGGFFGNLNWKWLGAIVISLVVIACAGELIVLLTGCEQYGTSLITNTLQEPATVVEAVEAETSAEESK